VPPVAEDGLLAAIQADLAASPFRGHGHRKVWARLRHGLGLVVGRNRVLRLMHENQLLSPYRHPPCPANDHAGTILTTAPDRLWGTDASKVQTVQDGRVWVFAALDHFNSEVVGHYVSTDGSRFAALEPVSQAVITNSLCIQVKTANVGGSGQPQLGDIEADLAYLNPNGIARETHLSRPRTRARVCESQADYMDDLILDTANACTPESSPADRVKIGAYQWRASRLKPKVYGGHRDDAKNEDRELTIKIVGGLSE